MPTQIGDLATFEPDNLEPSSGWGTLRFRDRGLWWEAPARVRFAKRLALLEALYAVAAMQMGSDGSCVGCGEEVYAEWDHQEDCPLYDLLRWSGDAPPVEPAEGQQERVA